MSRSLARVTVFCLGFFAAAALVRAAPADRSLTATGTITKIQASERAVTVALGDGSEARFVWNGDTKIGGVLSPGAKVTVRYEVGTDGRNLALQISINRGGT